MLNSLNFDVQRQFMKWNKQLLWTLILFMASAALYRVMPGRPYGFAPHIAMALFGGAVIRDRRWAFALPLFSLFISDALYQVLYMYQVTPIRGFYEGQWLNYLVLASVVLVGFFLKKKSPLNIAAFAMLAPTWFFLLSNFTVWMGGDGNLIPHTWAGLLETYILGIPFYANSIWATLFFSGIFFGMHHLLQQKAKAVTA